MAYQLRTYPEFELQTQICKYLDLQYPEILYSSDTIGSIRLTGQQAGRNAKIQKKGFKMPDLTIHEPKKGYHALYIELKVKTPYKKDGELRKDEHLEAQAESMELLRQKGYWADFRWSFEDVKKVIDWYLG